ncbi:hypothetical protein ABEB36_002427 [Hypothenemus hampei]|uniref:CN hydrolase domain-containing protein n=1 Tax=Hypothenemus hampei TaxID=57062 RepID=A0ABD1F5R3_HYPHA
MEAKLVFALFLLHKSNADYVGSIVEYNPIQKSSPTQTIEENINNYIYYTETAKFNGVQLLVFPEYGLTGLVSDPEEYAIVIPDVGTSNFDSDDILQRLSNAAFEHSVYLVINLLEKVNSTQIIYYNTNIVFASNGTLVAKYRKINLFGENKLTPGTELSIFSTEFGTFGLMTCADILFYNPSQRILENTNVTDVLFPTAWTSFLPFYMSIEVQVAYAVSNGVNLLAANINNPSNAMGGSSIVSADGTLLRKILTDNPASNIEYATITPPQAKSFVLRGFDIFDNARAPLQNYKNLTDFSPESYNFQSLDLTKSNITEQICHRSFCCSFSIGISGQANSSEQYRLVAYNGPTVYNNTEISIKFCSLISCLSEDVSSCGVRSSSVLTTVFNDITVWGSYGIQSEEFYRPISLRNDLDSVYNSSFIQSWTNDTVAVSFNTTIPTSNIIMFGIFVRSGVDGLCVSLGLVMVLLILQKLL